MYTIFLLEYISYNKKIELLKAWNKYGENMDINVNLDFPEEDDSSGSGKFT